MNSPENQMTDRITALQQTPQRLQIAVVGSASNKLNEIQQVLAYEVGKNLVACGCRLLCGGMGGVMEHAARGARDAEAYCPGDVIGLLPSYDKDEANPYIDIALPTGLGVARNAVLMAACDGVIALDGGSGTLSEIALAWQMHKPIACIGDEGWHHRLRSLQLDGRRDDALLPMASATEVAAFIEQIRHNATPGYNGIQHSQPDLRAMVQHLQSLLPEADSGQPYELLGRGSEGAVFRVADTVYKLYYPSHFNMLLFHNLCAMSQRIQAADAAPLPRFTVSKGRFVSVCYPYMESVGYDGGDRSAMIRFLRAMQQAGLCLSNVKAENFRCLPSGELIFTDIGRDLLGYSAPLFMSMCKRAFLTVFFAFHPEFRRLCSYTNDDDEFEGIAQIAGSEQDAVSLESQFREFFNEVTDAP